MHEKPKVGNAYLNKISIAKIKIKNKDLNRKINPLYKTCFIQKAFGYYHFYSFTTSHLSSSQENINNKGIIRSFMLPTKFNDI